MIARIEAGQREPKISLALAIATVLGQPLTALASVGHARPVNGEPYGKRIRRIRVESSRALRHVASDAGLTAVRLGQIERGVGSPATTAEQSAIERVLMD